MILLLGGTSETSLFAEGLTAAGYGVLVSTATEIPLAMGRRAGIQRRSGPLNEDALRGIIEARGIRAIADATHPYAVKIREMARRVAEQMNIPYLTYLRPTARQEGEDIFYAPNHEEAAGMAFSFGCPVLLTIGSKNLRPYVRQLQEAGLKLVVRVLGERRSLEACRSAGIEEEFIVTGRGPFSVAENRAVIRKFNIGVLVTKESGIAGGFPAKIEAARLEKCTVIVVQRPEQKFTDAFGNFADLLAAVRAKVPVETNTKVINKVMSALP
jgi:precorrin-6A/cobalt-precorrin-6A reductase